MTMFKGMILGGILAIPAVLSVSAPEIGPNDVVFNEFKVEQSLTGVPGDPASGATTFKDRGLGNCLACHATKAMARELFHGNVGPELDGAGSRWSEAELRGIVINSKKVFSEETMMPGFYTLQVGQQVAKARDGQTILTAQQVEDIVAFLATLKD